MFPGIRGACVGRILCLRVTDWLYRFVAVLRIDLPDLLQHEPYKQPVHTVFGLAVVVVGDKVVVEKRFFRGDDAHEVGAFRQLVQRRQKRRKLVALPRAAQHDRYRRGRSDLVVIRETPFLDGVGTDFVLGLDRAGKERVEVEGLGAVFIENRPVAGLSRWERAECHVSTRMRCLLARFDYEVPEPLLGPSLPHL